MRFVSSVRAQVDRKMTDRKWSLKLRFFCVVNLFIGFIALVTQLAILIQGRDSYAKLGVGIWAGIIFGIAGCALWSIADKSSKNYALLVATLLTEVAIIASIAMITTSAAVIFEEMHSPLNQDELSALRPPGEADAGLLKSSSGFIEQMMMAVGKASSSLKNNFSYSLYDLHLVPEVRIALEIILLVCGIITFVVNSIAGFAQVLELSSRLLKAYKNNCKNSNCSPLPK